MWLAEGDGRRGSGLLLMLAAGGLYVACRAALDALARPDGSDPGRRAIGQWLPVAATALAAVAMRLPEIAITVTFATSVAYLSLILGMAGYVAPMERTPPRSQAWPFLLPAALLCLVAGFSGVLTWLHAAMMLAMGVAILAVWLQRPGPEDPSSAFAGPDAADENSSSMPQRTVQLMLAIGLAALAGWAAVHATLATSRNSHLLSAGVVAATVLSPLLVLPSLGSAAAVGQRAGTGPAATALVGTVLLNLCLLLPMVIFLWYAMAAWPALRAAVMHPTTVGSSFALAQPFPYPAAVWRLETVVLVIIGFALIPVALGRWTLERTESALLVLGYIIYLSVVIFSARFG